jgi:hypothetical protein
MAAIEVSALPIEARRKDRVGERRGAGAEIGGAEAALVEQVVGGGGHGDDAGDRAAFGGLTQGGIDGGGVDHAQRLLVGCREHLFWASSTVSGR